MSSSSEAPEFEWDEAKRLRNLTIHAIDFWDALEVFERDHLVMRSDRHGEERWTAIGPLADTIVAVAFTYRERAIRLISARPAHRNERRHYHARFASGSARGPNQPRET
jgi:uncharacterized DUF497 family protein